MIMAMRAAVSTLDCRASRRSHSYCFPEFLYEVSNSAMMLLCQPLCALSLSLLQRLRHFHVDIWRRSTDDLHAARDLPPSSPLCGDARFYTP